MAVDKKELDYFKARHISRDERGCGDHGRWRGRDWRDRDHSKPNLNSKKALVDYKQMERRHYKQFDFWALA